MKPVFSHVWAMALTICLGLAVGVAPSAHAQWIIHWGGTTTVGAEALLYEDDTRVEALASMRLQARTLTYPWRIVFDGTLRAQGPMVGGGAWETSDEIDRLYLRLYSPLVDVTLGRQFVNWGVGYAWSPTDVFNPPDPTDPQGERRGIDAAVAQVSVNPLSYWTIALADERFGLRRRGSRSGTDWSIAAIWDKGDTVLGADLKGDLGVGWHMAWAHRIPKNSVTDPRTTLLIGTDYSWLAGDLFWVGEYLVETNPLTGNEADTHTFQQLTYRLDELSSISGSLLLPLQEGIRWWNVSYQTVLSAQSKLSIVLSLRDGEPGMELPLEHTRLSVKYFFDF